MICDVDGCERKAHAKRKCPSHYKRMVRHGDPGAGRRPVLPGTLAERMAASYDRLGPDDCWPWTAGMFGTGYGQIWVDGAPAYAHRVAYELAIGPIPTSEVVDHTCHNRDAACPGGDTCPHRRCMNPSHFEATTVAENVRRGRARGVSHQTA